MPAFICTFIFVWPGGEAARNPDNEDFEEIRVWGSE